MRAVMDRLPLWAAAFWWGSLTTVGFVAVPMLFMYLPTPAMAGGMAARLFTAQTWLSVVCTVLILLASRPSNERGDTSSVPTSLAAARLYIIAGLLLALLVEFAVAPRIVARENLALWHRVGSGMYVLQWVCATLTFWRLGRRA